MFKATIKGDKLKETVSALTALVDETKLNITEKGITARSVDAANVAMVAMELTQDAFETYAGTEGSIGLNLVKLESALEMVDKEDVVGLELDETSHKLKIEFGGITFTHSLLDPSTLRKEPNIPALNLPIEVSINGLDFKTGLKASEKVADYVRMGMADDTFKISAEGDTDAVDYVIPADRLKVVKAADATSLFSLDYLTKIKKVAEKATDVTLILGKDFPVKIKFPLAEETGTIEYMIAPRVEEQE
jgi:proliferating cell nuclear antigen